MTAEDNHNIWMETKKNHGYTYGKVIDTVKKTHVSIVSFEMPSDVEKRKDEMDILMVRLAKYLYDNVNNI